MTRQRKLITLTGVFAACIAGTVIVSRINFEEKMTGTETAIVDVDSADITYLAWNYEDTQAAFACEDGEWTCETDAQMPVDQDLLAEIAENLSQITSDKMVEEVQSLGVYGLSDPAYSITVRTADETYEIAVGDETFSDGEVYISNGDGYVYLTDAGLVDDISYTLLDCVQKEEIPEMERISAVTVENENTVRMVYQEDSGYCYSDAYTYYLKDGDTYRNLDNENAKDTFTALSEFSWEACVDYYADDSELEAYGLKDPAASVSVTYTPAAEEEDGSDAEPDENADADGGGSAEETFAFEVGSADDACYAKLKDSRLVYRISEEVYQAAVNASYEELKPDELILLDWDTVDRIEIELEGTAYTIGVEKDGDDAYQYIFQDAEIEFWDVLDQLSEMTAAESGGEDSEEETVPEGEPELSDNKAELSLTFHRNTDAYQTVELEFYQYDGAYCISVLDGESLSYTDRTSVVDLKEAVTAVILDSTSAR